MNVLSPAHPLWLAGFRPFFALACLAGALLPIVWVLLFQGTLPPLQTPLTPVQWHAHEMFYGFGWAVLGGFLLTATKNWVSIRGYHGIVLELLALAWIVERFAVGFGLALPAPLWLLLANLFLGGIVLMLVLTLLKHRQKDSYRRDNLYFLIALPLFLIAKNLLLAPAYFSLGWSMTLGLFRLAFLIMFERTLTQFMRAAFQVELLRRPWLDNTIKLCGLALVFAGFMPAPWAHSFEVLLAVAMTVRLAFWHPFMAMRRLDIGVMYLGYCAIVAQLLIEALPPPGNTGWVGTVGVHAFTFGAMGLVIPAMLIRIANGHTGRKIVFGAPEKSILYLMMLAILLRLVGPQWQPGLYLRWLDAAAACWFAAFAILAWRILPHLFRPRIDGREH